MSRIDEILAKQKALADELEMAKQEERDAVLKDIKEKIKRNASVAPRGFRNLLPIG